MKKNSLNINDELNNMKNNKGRGINHLLNMAYEILGNPIVMFDTSYQHLASTQNDVKDDFLWNELVETGSFSHDTVNFFSKEQFIEDVANTDIITVLKSKNLKYDRVNAKIFNKKGLQIANICIVACYKAFKNEDFKVIEKICEYLSEEIQISDYYKKIEKVYEETFVSDLIEGKKINMAIAEDKMDDLYENLKTNLYIAVIDITRYEQTLTHLAYFRDLFKKNISEFKYFIYLNNIVAIISTEDSLLNVKKNLSKLNKFCIDNNIYVGISKSFQNLFKLQTYYKQALNALNYGLNINVNNGQHIFEYDNFRIDYYLNSLDNNVDMKELCHPVIFTIKDYDKNNNTTYYNTLCTYFLSGMNSISAAKKLDMDNQDFNKQLKTMADIFGINWENTDMLVGIFLSMKISQHFL